MNAGVLLAAGASRRFGESKALWRPHSDGSTILEHLVAVYLEAKLSPVIVVTSKSLEGAISTKNIQIVRGDSKQPMIDSLARAIERLSTTNAVVVQPVDAMFTTHPMLHALVNAPDCDTDTNRARVCAYRGQPGHPVWVPRHFFAAILKRPDGGLRNLILPTAKLVEIDDPKVLADIDSKDDWAKWQPPTLG